MKDQAVSPDSRDDSENLRTIFFGTWYQRESVHFSEAWKFLSSDVFPPGFPEEKKAELSQRKNALALTACRRESNRPDTLVADVRHGFSWKFSAEGLLLLVQENPEFPKDFLKLRTYHAEALAPFFSALFAQGAPLPKEMANIRTVSPYVLVGTNIGWDEAEGVLSNASQKLDWVVETEDYSIYESAEVVLIRTKSPSVAASAAEAYVFSREFSGQLEKYMELHRTLWAKIEAIKDRDTIRGDEVDRLKEELSDYQKTVTLIGLRIEQMPGPLGLQRKRIRMQGEEGILRRIDGNLEDLEVDILYIRSLWIMTGQYLDSTFSLFDDLQNRKMEESFRALQFVMMFGAIGALYGHVSDAKIPKAEWWTLVPLIVVVGLAIAVHLAIGYFHRRKQYRMKSKDVPQDAR